MRPSRLCVVTGVERLALLRELVPRVLFGRYFARALPPPSFNYVVSVACHPGVGHLAPPRDFTSARDPPFSVPILQEFDLDLY